MDEELFNKQVQIERKLFSFTLKQKPRGRFLRITEEDGGRCDTVIVPSSGLNAIRAVMGDAIAASEKTGSIPSILPD